jgi:hypothetical protein
MIVRLHPVFHANNLIPCSTASLRLGVQVTIPTGDDEEFDVSHICVVSIKSLLFMTHLRDIVIPLVLHRLYEVNRTMALQYFLETPHLHDFAKTHAYFDFMRAHLARIRESK